MLVKPLVVQMSSFRPRSSAQPQQVLLSYQVDLRSPEILVSFENTGKDRKPGWTCWTGLMTPVQVLSGNSLYGGFFLPALLPA